MNEPENGPDRISLNPEHPGDRHGRTIFQRLRAYFIAGIVITAPIAITIYLVWLFISAIDEWVRPLIPAKYDPETYLPFSLPGLGVVLLLAIITLIGALAANYFGRLLLRVGERILDRMPVVSSIYATLKQIFQTVISKTSSSFEDVVLIEYPRRGLWAIAFVTGETSGEVQRRTERKMINIFLPTTPNPTSGFLLFVPKSDLIFLDMTIEEGIKHVISAGLVTPPDGNHEADSPESAENSAEDDSG